MKLAKELKPKKRVIPHCKKAFPYKWSSHCTEKHNRSSEIVSIPDGVSGVWWEWSEGVVGVSEVGIGKEGIGTCVMAFTVPGVGAEVDLGGL